MTSRGPSLQMLIDFMGDIRHSCLCNLINCTNTAAMTAIHTAPTTADYTKNISLICKVRSGRSDRVYLIVSERQTTTSQTASQTPQMLMTFNCLPPSCKSVCRSDRAFHNFTTCTRFIGLAYYQRPGSVHQYLYHSRRYS